MKEHLLQKEKPIKKYPHTNTSTVVFRSIIHLNKIKDKMKRRPYIPRSKLE